ncbi:MAG: hypothetical protein JXA44_08490 [Methanospirillaceae archaeon]|nr:hypothetical protein [Methanospirillaceae archaeon]
MNSTSVICIILLCTGLIPGGQAIVKEDLLPSQSEIASLFEPYPFEQVYDDLYPQYLDYAYSYYQSRSWNPVIAGESKTPREEARIFFRIKIFSFDPDDKSGKITGMRQEIEESTACESYSKKEHLDIGDIGYYQDVYDPYEGGPPRACNIAYITGNHTVEVHYSREVESEGFSYTYEDPAQYLKRCIGILKAPEGQYDIPVTTPDQFSSLEPQIIPDSPEYQAGEPYSLTIRVADTDKNPVNQAEGLIVFSSGETTPVPAVTFTTDSSGTGLITGVWPPDIRNRVNIRVEVEKDGFRSGSDETSVSFRSVDVPKEDQKDSLNKEIPEKKEEEKDNLIAVKISFLLYKPPGGSFIAGSIQKPHNGGYVPFYPENSKDVYLTIVVTDEEGNEHTVEMKTRVDPDGTFRISDFEKYHITPEIVWDAIRKDTFDVLIF